MQEISNISTWVCIISRSAIIYLVSTCNHCGNNFLPEPTRSWSCAVQVCGDCGRCCVPIADLLHHRLLHSLISNGSIPKIENRVWSLFPSTQIIWVNNLFKKELKSIMMLIQSRVWRKKDLMAHIRNEINNIQAPRNGERRRRLLPCNWLTDRELYSARDRIYWFLIKIDLHLSPPPLSISL